MAVVLIRTASLVLLMVGATACQPVEPSSGRATAGTASEGAPPTPITPDRGSENRSFAAISAGETINLVGTEPFWGGTLKGGELVYSTPENQQGEAIAVTRFAGNGGLGFSGTWQGRPLDLTVTQGACSDGMSDRSFPFTATLRLGEEQRNGCAWTDRQPFTGADRP